MLARVKGRPSSLFTVNDQEKISSASPEGGEFYFENIKPGSYKALLKYVGKECIFAMIIPESTDMIIDLKDVLFGS